MTKKKTEAKEPMTAADLIQDEHNYRKHSETNKKRIRKSIDEAGLGRSVVVKRTDLHEGDERRKKLALADNATSDDVEWDMEAIEADGWEQEELENWGVVEMQTETDINGLFDEEKESKRKEDADIQVIILIPSELKDKEQDIRSAIEITLQEWQGCSLK